MFLLTFLVVNMADTKRKLENDIFAAAGIAQKYNCALTRLDYQQEAGLMSSIPLGENLIPIQRGLTTSSTAIFIPFITQELFQTGSALYYGLNALSNNMILCDRKQLKNPNGLILGTPGSGKSFAAKREITNAFLITDDDIFICDPEAEYFALVKRLGGQVIRLSPTGKGMDGKPQYAGEDELRGLFRGMRRLFDQLRDEDLPNVEMRELSMGMSRDYRIAAQEGATMVRVGTALYQD